MWISERKQGKLWENIRAWQNVWFIYQQFLQDLPYEHVTIVFHKYHTALHKICAVCSVEELTILTFACKCKYCLKQTAFLLFLFALVNQFSFENSIIIQCTQTDKRLTTIVLEVHLIGIFYIICTWILNRDKVWKLKLYLPVSDCLSSWSPSSSSEFQMESSDDIDNNSAFP